jgi:xylulose-5-phosphate/fructose-6-phosphate phosphoketolase
MDAIFVKSSSTTGIGGENIDVSNPPAIASHIPDVISTLAVELDKTKLDRSMNETLLEFRNAANYIAAG